MDIATSITSIPLLSLHTAYHIYLHPQGPGFSLSLATILHASGRTRAALLPLLASCMYPRQVYHHILMIPFLSLYATLAARCTEIGGSKEWRCCWRLVAIGSDGRQGRYPLISSSCPGPGPGWLRTCYQVDPDLTGIYCDFAVAGAWKLGMKGTCNVDFTLVPCVIVRGHSVVRRAYSYSQSLDESADAASLPSTWRASFQFLPLEETWPSGGPVESGRVGQAGSRISRLAVEGRKMYCRCVHWQDAASRRVRGWIMGSARRAEMGFDSLFNLMREIPGRCQQESASLWSALAKTHTKVRLSRRVGNHAQRRTISGRENVRPLCTHACERYKRLLPCIREYCPL